MYTCCVYLLIEICLHLFLSRDTLVKKLSRIEIILYHNTKVRRSIEPAVKTSSAKSQTLDVFLQERKHSKNQNYSETPQKYHLLLWHTLMRILKGTCKDPVRTFTLNNPSKSKNVTIRFWAPQHLWHQSLLFLSDQGRCYKLWVLFMQIMRKRSL